MSDSPKQSQLQIDKFRDVARALECDESEECFNAALGQIVRHKPKPDAQPKTDEESNKDASDERQG